jgi:4-diphosphocytidyl-2-C-methyl-D-erythritol kinase
MKVKSYAKINLFLDITGVDEKDGYHYIDSLFQEVTLHDEIKIRKSKYDSVIFNNPSIPRENTVSIALCLFKEAAGISQAYSITVDKRIPSGAGLGGGSSNAAAVLRALAEIHKINLKDIIPIGEKIGSDVPFFFTGGLCRVRGKGEIITKSELKLRNLYFVIIYPGKPVSTKWAYSLITGYNPPIINENNLNPQTADIDFLKKIVYNKFQFLVFNNCPDLAEVKTRLDGFLDSRLSFMSGSGSSLVYVYTEREKARRMTAEARMRFGFDAFFCEPYNR